MQKVKALKKEKKAIIEKFGQRSNIKALWQTLNTTIPYFLLFYISIESLSHSIWLFIASTSILILFLMRVFMMMHDCGHDSLYNNPYLNKIVGFFMGVLCGIPQQVWSKHHAYHHATNGDWEKYQGPLSCISTEQYEQLSTKQQKAYRKNRNIWLAPIGGFMYFIFNPRFNWLKGCIQFLFHALKNIFTGTLSPKKIINSFETRCWGDWQEFFHMTGNNIVLITACFFAGMYFGWAEFLFVYVLVISLSGALGIILFTIQHNFEHSYATDSASWDYYRGALEGTSYLDLPRILHWFTADIGYHHVHHLNAKIPNYNLRECHKEYEELFSDVTRVKLSDVSHSFKYILWDNTAGRMISVAEYDANLNAVNA
ncbi:fatty acid desaturase [Marinomonas agarivorans]|nr:fatty acid desaturase [Marinomonas agarivorans]